MAKQINAMTTVLPVKSRCDIVVPEGGRNGERGRGSRSELGRPGGQCGWSNEC
jgi:hypothetical protein